MLYKFKDFYPDVAEDVFIAPGAHVIGRVTIGEMSSIWFNTVIRGDINSITIGKYTNIQDGSVVHTDPAYPTVIGDYVLVGHKAILHGCVVGDGCLIGMGAILLDGSRIGQNTLVAAGALVKEGQEIPEGVLVVGAPARVVRELRPEELEKMRRVTMVYAERGQVYRRSLK